ncbi:sugar phosphate isomerase/epimerase [Candidatus Desantisbacteria bacterium]|nr:sugar phosphate isomerase/epimerase [Candidatus Desantisbacteria bacterium]
MKLGFFINAYRNFSIEYALESIKEQGYQGVELWAKGSQLSPYDPERRLKEIENKIHDFGLTIYGISAHLDFVSPSERTRKENIDKFLGCIQMAELFKVRAVHTASGGLYPESELSFHKQEEYFYHAMEIIGKEARSKNIIVALEPEPEKWLSRPEQVLEAIKNLNNPVFRVLVDVGHCFGVGEEVQSYLEKVNSFLHLIHIDDVFRKDFPHRHLIPGEGDINFVQLFTYLESINYDGWLSVELNKHNDDPKTASNLAKIFIDNLMNNVGAGLATARIL